MTNNKCCALLKNKGIRCNNSSISNNDFCGIHLKSKNVIRYDKQSDNSLSNEITDIKTSIIIPIEYRHRLRYNTVKVRELKETLAYYGQNNDGNKKELFEKM